MAKYFVIIFGFLIFSCSNDNELNNEIIKQLKVNIDFKEKNIQNLTSKRSQKIQEGRHSVYKNFNYIDSLFKNISNKLSESIDNNTLLPEETLTNYSIFSDSIFKTIHLYTKEKNPDKISLDLNSINKKDLKTSLLLYKNNVEMSYLKYLNHVLYSNGSFAIDTMKNYRIFSELVKNPDGTAYISLKNINIQRNPADNIIIVDNISNSKSDFDIELDGSFAKIKLKKIEKGNHIIKGKIRFFEYDRELIIPFKHEFKID